MGYDPYSASKQARKLSLPVTAMRFLGPRLVGFHRAANVIGGDWARDRLIPDLVRAWEAGAPAHSSSGCSTPRRMLAHWPAICAGGMLMEESRTGRPIQFRSATHELATVRDVVESARRHTVKVMLFMMKTALGPHEAGLLT